MLESGKAARFFLSANSPQGYLSSFSNLYSAKEGWKAYILTGAYSEAKSELLKNIGNALEAAGENTEYIYSCLDPGTIDAVAFSDIRICIIDGTPPNSLAAEYPGVTESIINLGAYLDEDKLSAFREKIILFTSRVNASSDRAYRFLSAASSLLNDTCRLALECTDVEKIESYATHISRREFPSKGRQGLESLRFLSAITPDGLQNLLGGMSGSYERIYEIEDEFGLGKLFLNKIRCGALSSGYDVISCCCPMFPDGKPEHLLIPSLSLAFITTGHSHPFEGEGTRHIHIRRFIDRDTLKLKRPRISFNRKASRELIDEAILLLDDARASRRMIISCYHDATDAEAVVKLTGELTDKLLALKAKQ
jgi:hypothetical protein